MNLAGNSNPTFIKKLECENYEEAFAKIKKHVENNQDVLHVFNIYLKVGEDNGQKVKEFINGLDKNLIAQFNFINYGPQIFVKESRKITKKVNLNLSEGDIRKNIAASNFDLEILINIHPSFLHEEKLLGNLLTYFTALQYYPKDKIFNNIHKQAIQTNDWLCIQFLHLLKGGTLRWKTLSDESIEENRDPKYFTVDGISITTFGKEDPENDVKEMISSLDNDRMTKPLYDFITIKNRDGKPWTISIDFVCETVAKMIHNESSNKFSHNYAYTDNEKKIIYLGKCQNIRQRYAAFVHEVFHAAAFTIYKNEGIPYFKLGVERAPTRDEWKNQRVEFKMAFTEARKKSMDNSFPEEIIDWVFAVDDNTYQKREIVPRIPHLINLYRTLSPDRLEKLQENYSKLFEYYMKYCWKQIDEYKNTITVFMTEHILDLEPTPGCWLRPYYFHRLRECTTDFCGCWSELIPNFCRIFRRLRRRTTDFCSCF